MFKIEAKNLKIYSKIGISDKERKQKQLLKITLFFEYSVAKNKNLDDIKNLKDYSLIIKFLKNYIENNQHKTLEKLISATVNIITKKFKLKKVKLKINKTQVAKRYGAESLSVSN